MCHTHSSYFVLSSWLLFQLAGLTEFHFHTDFKSVLKILIQSGKYNRQLAEMLSRVHITIAPPDGGLCRRN